MVNLQSEEFPGNDARTFAAVALVREGEWPIRFAVWVAVLDVAQQATR